MSLGGGTLGERRYEVAPDVVNLTKPRERAAQAVRATAAEVVGRHVNRGHRGLAICGISSGVGASFLTANLAVALSEAGVSTLIVDANLRRPGQEHFFRPAGPVPGLRQVLGPEELSLADVVHQDVISRLSIVYAGQDEGRAADHLLGGERFRLFMEECLREHECTLVDTPGANLAPDARRVASVVGYALVVARRNLTFARDVALFMRELSVDGSTVIGSMLNAA